MKGSIYEGLLERNAQEVKSGVDLESRESVHDPACGTGGFLLAAWEQMRNKPLARNAEIYAAMRRQLSGVDIGGAEPAIGMRR